jgi:uncharacterized membrane protein
MGMRVHELHAVAVHAPLVVLPAAAIVDLAAASSGDRHQARLGRTLWWLGAASGAFAGVAGLAASQEVRAGDRGTNDMMWLHGLGNVTLVLGAFGVAAWRRTRPPSVAQATLGLLVTAASAYTAYLGGELVYERGVGITRMPRYTGGGVRDSPPLLSRRAPLTFLRDAIRGFGWLLGRGRQVVGGREPLTRAAFGLADRQTQGAGPPIT